MHIYDQRWFIVARIVTISAIILYSLVAVYSSSLALLGQPTIQDRIAQESGRAADLRARVRALEAMAEDRKADKVAERLVLLEAGQRSMEKSVLSLAEELNVLNRMATAILLGMVAFLSKELIALLKRKQE